MKAEDASRFHWTPHRFTGGRLVLDLCNTVILRYDASRSLDRFAVSDNLETFGAAAAQMCAEPWPPDALRGPPGNVIALREAADRHFRACAHGKADDALLALLLDEAATALRGPSRLAASAARSALRLVAADDNARIKICQSCGWLFHDRSKSRSRLWCDMAVCGNRNKARRHYARTRGKE
jgi:predicted RNA-binding Zn ribbon-like protein